MAGEHKIGSAIPVINRGNAVINSSTGQGQCPDFHPRSGPHTVRPMAKGWWFKNEGGKLLESGLLLPIAVPTPSSGGGAPAAHKISAILTSSPRIDCADGDKLSALGTPFLRLGQGSV